MGLSIELQHCYDCEPIIINMCYSKFYSKILTHEDMIKYKFKNDREVYKREALDFLVHRLIINGYLSQKYKNYKFKKAVFI
jgi:hypothetical protein